MAKKISTEEKFEKVDFDLFKAIEAIDKKDYNYFDNLTDEQKKKFVPYMMLHWISTVKGNSTLSAYYLLTTDMVANKHMFNEKLQHHPELQWLMMCASSPGIGKQFHQWIPHLSNKLGELRDKAKVKEVHEYFEKIYKGVETSVIKECANEYVSQQNHKYRLAQIYPTMKLSDVEFLSKYVSDNDLNEYDRHSGN